MKGREDCSHTALKCRICTFDSQWEKTLTPEKDRVEWKMEIWKIMRSPISWASDRRNALRGGNYCCNTDVVIIKVMFKPFLSFSVEQQQRKQQESLQQKYCYSSCRAEIEIKKFIYSEHLKESCCAVEECLTEVLFLPSVLSIQHTSAPTACCKSKLQKSAKSQFTKDLMNWDI